MEIENASRMNSYASQPAQVARYAESTAEAEPDRDADDARRSPAARPQKAAEIRPDYIGNKVDLLA